MQKSVAVIILNWNGRELLREFLPSVVRYSNPEIARVIVADNCSEDGSIELLKEEFPQVDVLRFEKNHGFAGGYNLALKAVEEKYVVLLNSDVEVTEGWLEPMLGLMEQCENTAAVQPKIRAHKEKEKFEYAGGAGGYIDRWGFPFCRGRIVDVTERDCGQYDDIREVFWASGAALLVRRELYLKAGGLDEDFFAHMEEIDLCWRLRNAGYMVKVVPESLVYHLGGGSLPMNHPKKLFLNYRNNLLMLYKNLTVKERRKVLFIRSLLDVAACTVFLLKGEFKNASSVVKAYTSFWKMKKKYGCPTEVRKDVCIYRGSIVYAYFVRKIKYFSALPWKK